MLTRSDVITLKRLKLKRHVDPITREIAPEVFSQEPIGKYVPMIKTNKTKDVWRCKVGLDICQDRRVKVVFSRVC